MQINKFALLCSLYEFNPTQFAFLYIHQLPNFQLNGYYSQAYLNWLLFTQWVSKLRANNDAINVVFRFYLMLTQWAGMNVRTYALMGVLAQSLQLETIKYELRNS